ncbi:DUF3558 family protein [Saccharomonospora xinjiangensis]|uniref:DUF3558 family protein n=1 Tax=Saccharomonospora xinjiangensis TaxID=75294 RepID=UPI00106FAEE2|nr:DUF3558 family protein [Saccharomonospora xinjiangensis]
MKIAFRKASIAIVAMFASVLSSCSSTEKGIAEPPKSLTGSPSGVEATSSSAEEPTSVAIDPCELLSVEDLTEHGAFESQGKQIGSARSCVFERGVEASQEMAIFSLSVRDSQGVDTVNDDGGGVVAAEVNGRPAAVAESPLNGSCTIAMKLSDASRIDVTITIPPDREEGPCRFGEKIAKLIEPRLPEAS